MEAPADDATELRLELPPEPTSVPRARHAVSELAGKLGAEIDSVALAVSEAVGNAVLHGFRGRKGGRISVRAGPVETDLVVVVADDGVGMVPHVESRGLGMGTSLITRMATEARFQSSHRGTTVTMRFALPGGAQGGGGESDA